MAPRKRKQSFSLESLSKRLHGSQFRRLNEELYLKSGEENFARFSSDPSLAEAYHRGFREQALRWPCNPLDVMIESLKKKSRRVVADFGCGEARLGEELQSKHLVHSFDLVAVNDRIKACNMAHTGLKDGEVDVAVFCLALMGPSFLDFLREAFRCLRVGGLLKVAEVRSRFDESSGGVAKFARTLKAIGFDKVAADSSNSHFLMFDFVKSNRTEDLEKAKKIGFDFKPCLYKKR